MPDGFDGRYTFSLLHDTYFSDESRHVLLSRKSELTIRVRRRAKIQGTVTRPDGTPASGILLMGYANGPQSKHQQQAYAVTDQSGAYQMTVYPHEPLIVAVVNPHWVSDVENGIELKDGQSRDGVDFTLQTGTTIRGTISADDVSGPPSGRYVSLTHHHRNGFGFRRSERTDEQGQYQFCVQPGRYLLILPNSDRHDLLVDDESEIVIDGAMPHEDKTTQ